MRRTPVLAGVLLLCGCSTVRGWVGMAPDDEPPPPPMKARAPVAEVVPVEPLDVRPDATPETPSPAPAATKPRTRRSSDDLRKEIKSIESDARSGAIGVKETRKRLSALRDDLEAALRDEARGGGVRADLESKLDEILRRLDEIEARLEGLEKR